MGTREVIVTVTNENRTYRCDNRASFLIEYGKDVLSVGSSFLTASNVFVGLCSREARLILLKKDIPI